MNKTTITPIVEWLRRFPAVGTLVTDSRRVRPGDIFFAYPIGKDDGRRYIAQAVASGAQGIVYEDGDFAWPSDLTVPHLAVPDLLWQSGSIVSDFLDVPDAGMFVTAVTGTNGKTSCTQWLAHALSLTGTPTCVIGTLGLAVVRNGRADEFDHTGFTTPDAVQLQQKIALQRTAGCTALAIEASSIGLAQGRMNGMHIDVAVFTNLTRDHLDFHGDMVQYEAAKRRLFEWPGLGAAVLNLDDPAGGRLADLCLSHGYRVLAYSTEESVARAAGIELLRASNLRSHQGGTSFELDSPFGSGLVKTRMIGRFNVSNVLAVLATLFAKGVAWQDAIEAVEQLHAVAGRMEQLSAPGRVLVIIDYAHTPDALDKTLRNLREVALQRQGKLWCVFGCGGDRDPGKRVEMGGIAELADQIIITSDNPRSEDPVQIIAQIAAGLSPTRLASAVLEPDRAKAILFAIKNAGPNDVVLLAGKGHEATQEIKGKKLPFSDIDHANIALAALASKGVG